MSTIRQAMCASAFAALLMAFVCPPATAGVSTNDRWPHFSRDGRSIAFTSNRAGNLAVYVMNADGSALHEIKALEGSSTGGFAADWFPNGDILYASEQPTASGPDNGLALAEFLRAAPAAAGPTILFAGINVERPSLSPSGERIAFESERGPFSANPEIDIEVFDIRTLTVHALTSGGGQHIQAAWSPDGSQIAFACRERATDDLQICVMHFDGSDPRTVTSGSGSHEWPAWSPDSKRLAYFVETTHDGTTDSVIAVTGADGRNTIDLTHHDKALRDETPSWSPDGKHIAFQTNRQGGGFLIAVMNDDGSDLTMLTH